MTNRADHFVKMQSQRDDIDAGSSALENKVDQAKGDARLRDDKELDKLRQQSRGFQSRLEDLKSAGEDQWDRMTAEIKTMGDALEHACKHFRSQL